MAKIATVIERDNTFYLKINEINALSYYLVLNKCLFGAQGGDNRGYMCAQNQPTWYVQK